MTVLDKEDSVSTPFIERTSNCPLVAGSISLSYPPQADKITSCTQRHPALTFKTSNGCFERRGLFDNEISQLLVHQEDLQRVSESLVTKKDLEFIARKKDLEFVATKKDVEFIASKKDVEFIASKKDVEFIASKKDVEFIARKKDVDDILKNLSSYSTKKELETILTKGNSDTSLLDRNLKELYFIILYILIAIIFMFFLFNIGHIS